jgi:hypothetical protein
MLRESSFGSDAERSVSTDEVLFLCGSGFYHGAFGEFDVSFKIMHEVRNWIDRLIRLEPIVPQRSSRSSTNGSSVVCDR